VCSQSASAILVWAAGAPQTCFRPHRNCLRSRRMATSSPGTGCGTSPHAG